LEYSFIIFGKEVKTYSKKNPSLRKITNERRICWEKCIFLKKYFLPYVFPPKSGGNTTKKKGDFLYGNPPSDMITNNGSVLFSHLFMSF